MTHVTHATGVPVDRRTHVKYLASFYSDGSPAEPDRVNCEPDDPEAEACASYIARGKWEGWHSPVLDIDFPARLVPSTTEGHFHLYLDGLTMRWETYAKLLEALAEAGVIEDGYAGASISRESTYVRLPHVRKEIPK